MIIINLLILFLMKLDWLLEELRVVIVYLKVKFLELIKSEEVKWLIFVFWYYGDIEFVVVCKNVWMSF